MFPFSLVCLILKFNCVCTYMCFYMVSLNEYMQSFIYLNYNHCNFILVEFKNCL